MFATETTAGTAPVTDAIRPQLVRAWKEIIEPVEPFLDAVARRLAAQVREFEPDIAAYAEYALSGQGKQLRPVLVALSGHAVGKLNESHVTVAVIIEMVHLATLVHDDVMDEAGIRRGRLTLAAHWGSEIAVLLGDCLFAQALKLAASFPTPEICRAVSAATGTVCSGEILQTQQRGNFELSQADYFRVIEMKTGELFALSCDLGAALGGAHPAQRTALRQFGLALGTAYQVYDDCLDLFGSESAAGKSLGTDLAKGKLTLPVLAFWKRADAGERARLRQLVEKSGPRSAARVVELLARHDALGESLETLNDWLEGARSALRPLGDSAVVLLALTDFLGRQTETLEACA